MDDSRHRFRRLDTVLASGALGHLRAGAERRAACEHALRSVLGPPLDAHVRVGGLDADTLVVVVDAAAWAARLRFVPPSAVAELAERLGWPELRRLRAVVRPPRGVAEPEAPSPAELSEHARGVIDDAARATTNPGLREVLARLARRRRGD